MVTLIVDLHYAVTCIASTSFATFSAVEAIAVQLLSRTARFITMAYLAADCGDSCAVVEGELGDIAASRCGAAGDEDGAYELRNRDSGYTVR
jgi:hypothetical protein